MRSAMILWVTFLSFLLSTEGKVVSNDKNEVANGNGTVVVVNIRNLNKTQYHNQNFRQGNYNYGYDIKPDGPLGQFHHENKAEDGVVYGCYGYVDPLDKPQITYYVSDSWGYRSLVQGHPIKVFYPKDHPEGVTEMKGHELKWAQLQFPQQCDGLEETMVTANPKPLVQAESAPIAYQPATVAPVPAPAPARRPTPSTPAPVSKKSDQTPLSVMLTFGPTASLDGITGPSKTESSGYPAAAAAPTAEASKPVIRIDGSVPPATQSDNRLGPDAGAGYGYEENAGTTEVPRVVVIGYGEAPENDAVAPINNPNRNNAHIAQNGVPAEHVPVSGGYDHAPAPTANPERFSGGSSGERGGYGGPSGIVVPTPSQQSGEGSGYNRAAAAVPANSRPQSQSDTGTRNERPFSSNTPTPTSGSHRVPELSIHITQPNYEDGSKPYPQSAENDDDNYYAGGSNKNIIYPNSKETPSAYDSGETISKQADVPLPNTDYRPPSLPSPTINYIQRAPEFTDQIPANESSGSQRGNVNTQKQGNSDTSYGIRTPDGQSYPSSRRPVASNLQESYPSPTAAYEGRPAPSSLTGGINYNNRGEIPSNPGNPNPQVPAGNGGGCNGGCQQQQQPPPPTQDPHFIDYSQFPGAVVSNVPVIFYPDCRSNAFTRPAVVPFCPSLQPSAQPSAAQQPSGGGCSHSHHNMYSRQPLTMRFPSEQSNIVYSNNYDLPSTRGAYPTNNFVTATVRNPIRTARRVVRRSRGHVARQVNNNPEKPVA